MAASYESWTLLEKMDNWLWLSGGKTIIAETLRSTTLAHELFYWLLNMSIAGTITGLIVWLIGRWRRVPRRLAHMLWVLPLIRLWLPLSLTSPFSIYSLLPEGAVTTVPHAGFVDDLSGWNSLHLVLSYHPVTYKTDALHQVFTTASAVWFAVTALLMVLMLAVYLRDLRDTGGTDRLQFRVYASDRVTSPAVYGIIDPQIIIPRSMADGDLTYVLAHEQAHIRRRDNLWRLIALVTACVHWFNPFIWLMLRAFLRETELACDESVVSRLDEAGRRAYAHALVDAAERRAVLVSPFGGAGLKVRITRIVSFRSLSGAGLFALLLLAGALAWALLTNAP